jgi:hypothetical protein
VGESKGKQIIERPIDYLAEQASSLDERLAALRLPPGTEEVIVSKKTKKLIRDKVLGLFKVGQLISELLNWNESVEKEIRDAKKSVLLAHYFELSDANVQSVSALKGLLTSGPGNTLFNKIIQILDDNPPDQMLIEQLARALRRIVESDFASLFEEHRYALSQIEQMSPQALAILADHAAWPIMTLGALSATGQKVNSDWLQEFSAAYVAVKGVSDPALASRIRYSISELITRRIVEAHLIGNTDARCVVTEIGSLLLPYVTA